MQKSCCPATHPGPRGDLAYWDLLRNTWFPKHLLALGLFRHPQKNSSGHAVTFLPRLVWGFIARSWHLWLEELRRWILSSGQSQYLSWLGSVLRSRGCHFGALIPFLFLGNYVFKLLFPPVSAFYRLVSQGSREMQVLPGKCCRWWRQRCCRVPVPHAGRALACSVTNVAAKKVNSFETPAWMELIKNRLPLPGLFSSSLTHLQAQQILVREHVLLRGGFSARAWWPSVWRRNKQNRDLPGQHFYLLLRKGKHLLSNSATFWILA